jgi:hypothetical protein
MKGQAMQMLGFLVLAITVIVVILFMRTFLASSYGRGLSRISERHQTEGFRAGSISILQTTDDNTDRTILELLGIAAYQTNKDLDFGEAGQVDVLEELEWRMNEIYGEGNWYVKIPYPDIIPRYQMIIIIDSSGTLCDDFQNIKTNLPIIIEDLRDRYNIAITIFMLPGGSRCCDTGSGSIRLNCDGLFGIEEGEDDQIGTRRDLHCINLDRSSVEDLDRDMCDSSINPENSEDWGRGLACAIDVGPYEGWYDFTAKIGIILSDELPWGSENHGLNENRDSLEIGIGAARDFMRVFPLKAETGKNCCPSCSNCPSHCELCVRSSDHNYHIFNQDACNEDTRLRDYMDRFAIETDGELYILRDSGEAAGTIGRILDEHIFDINPYLEIGTNPPANKNINSEVVPVAVPFVGGYTNIYMYTWA